MPVFMMAAPFVARSALAFFRIPFRPLLFISKPRNFSRLLWLSSSGRFSCQDASSLSRAIILLQSRSSILPPPRTLSCSVASDNFGSPLLVSIWKCMHCMFRANTISLRIVWVAGTQMLQLVTVFIVYVVTLISFFIFKLSNLRVFLSMLRDHICLFCFVFLFDFRPLCGIRWPTSSADVSVVSLQSLVSRLITLAHTTSTQKNMAAHIRSYQTFCELRTLQSFPISVQSISLYIACLVTQKRAYGTILNHLSSLKHTHKFSGNELT